MKNTLHISKVHMGKQTHIIVGANPRFSNMAVYKVSIQTSAIFHTEQ